MSKNIKKIAVVGLLLALEIIISRFLSYSSEFIKISFAFIPVVICAILFGPVYSAILAGLGDFLGAILFPIGAYFPGFTLTAALTGAVFGLFLHKKTSVFRIVISVTLTQIIFSLFINSYWLSVLYSGTYFSYLIPRIVQTLILILVQIVCITIIDRFIVKKIKI